MNPQFSAITLAGKDVERESHTRLGGAVGQRVVLLRFTTGRSLLVSPGPRERK